MTIKWIDGFEITAEAGDGAAYIRANREGLLSLAGILAALAEESDGSHIHLDACNSLEEGSAELIIEKEG
ncbi:MAG: hypothetical protein J5758_01365 [Abditibacteriota bacterium]|nr:hypothetical protein [Abditibacteriota bacterium]